MHKDSFAGDKMRYAVAFLSILLGCASMLSSECKDEYHVVVFSYNNPTGMIRPTQTHTFASWIHTKNHKIIEEIDISWGPVEGGLNLFRGTVPGRHKSLSDTIADCKGMAYQHWTLSTSKSFFETARKQQKGLKHYIVLDGGTRPKAVNCIHACSDVAGHLKTGTSCGIPAGQMVVDFFNQTGKAKTADESWVVEAIMKHNNCTLPGDVKFFAKTSLYPQGSFR